MGWHGRNRVGQSRGSAWLAAPVLCWLLLVLWPGLGQAQDAPATTPDAVPELAVPAPTPALPGTVVPPPGPSAAPAPGVATPEAPVLPPIRQVGPPRVKLLQYLPAETVNRFANYPGALESLLREIATRTSLAVDTEVTIIQSFDDPIIFRYPFIYVNYADREDWQFSVSERDALRRYLERGGFLFIDAGINAEFLRGNRALGQHHSFADWQVTPELEASFKEVLPTRAFEPLKRSHPLFRAFYPGLPDPSILPETVREYVVTEKWPQGTYSALGITLNGRLAVLATPIIAMGWGRDATGNWQTTIGFRIRESAPGVDEILKDAGYTGESFKARREDGAYDTIYCQREGMPAWVKEPDGRWRVFRYYHSREISDYAHTFYTQLGVNILVHALTH